MLQIVRLFDEPPDGFDDLVAEASGEGVRNMALLAEDWRNGARFQDDGEALLAAFLAGELAGIGGLAVEPDSSEPARRLRRFYVRTPRRRTDGSDRRARPKRSDDSRQWLRNPSGT